MTHSTLQDVDVQYRLSGQICSQVNHAPKHPRTPAAAERSFMYTVSFESPSLYFFLAFISGKKNQPVHHSN